MSSFLGTPNELILQKYKQNLCVRKYDDEATSKNESHSDIVHKGNRQSYRLDRIMVAYSALYNKSFWFRL